MKVGLSISDKTVAALAPLLALLAYAVFRPPAEATRQTAFASGEPASIEIDSSKVEGRLSLLLYGQFAAFMLD